MSAHEHLGPQFAALAASFKAKIGDSYDHPHCARGECNNASEAFENHAPLGSGVATEVHESADAFGVPYHAYNTYRGHAVDWTARQFMPDAEVPHVEPHEQYKKRLAKDFQ